jgi:hypothetical protein
MQAYLTGKMRWTRTFLNAYKLSGFIEGTRGTSILSWFIISGFSFAATLSFFVLLLKQVLWIGLWIVWFVCGLWFAWIAECGFWIV